MKIVFISDTHSQHDQLQIPECDLLIHSGDISTRGYEDEVMDFCRWFESQPAKEKVFIAGNHDFFFQKNPRAREKIINFNLRYLEDELLEILGLSIYGTPWQPWFRNWAFNFEPGELGELEAHHVFNQIPSSLDILITHGPPYGIMDRVARSPHPQVGCPQLLGRVQETKPKIHAFGHIHEEYGQQQIDETLFINASTCTLQYKPTNPPVIITL